MLKKIFLFLSVTTSISILTTHDHGRPTIIALYGCSSAGKTTLSTALLKTLSDHWVYIPSNQYRSSGNLSRNELLWRDINLKIAQGFNVIVDTHSLHFLVDRKHNPRIFVTLVYCTPAKLLDHIYNRNQSDNKNNHRTLTHVFKEYVDKFQPVSKNQEHIDIIHRKDLEDQSFFTMLALKKIVHKYFTDKNQKKAYIAPYLTRYDYLLDAGKVSAQQGALTIKKMLETTDNK